MHLGSWVLVAAVAGLGAAARGGDEGQSRVRVALEAATARVGAATAERDAEYGRIAGDPGPEAGRAALYDAAVARHHAAATPAVEALLDAAAADPGDPSCMAALRFVLVEARGLAGPVDRALALLNRDHVGAADASLAGDILFLHGERPSAAAFLRAVAAGNPSRVERGRACFALAELFRRRASAAGRARSRPPGSPAPADDADADIAALRRDAAGLLERCLAEFADVPLVEYPGFPDSIGRTVGGDARGALADVRDLLVGMPAPEVAGPDVEGRPLRLRDHRGRVVVLVFSGQWCGPCRAAGGHLRALLDPAAQRAAPCVVLEVNTDESREPIRRAIAAGEVAWPCWLDGGTAGPIATAWGVGSFPTIFVLDADGIIRARDLRGEAVAGAVAAALRDQPPGPPRR